MKQNRRAAGTNIARDERRVLFKFPIEMRLIVIPQTGPDIESGHTPISTVREKPDGILSANDAGVRLHGAANRFFEPLGNIGMTVTRALDHVFHTHHPNPVQDDLVIKDTSESDSQKSSE